MKKLHLFFMALLVLCLGLFVSACSLKIVNDGEDGEITVRLKEYKPQIELGKTYEIPFEVINTEVSFEYEIEDKSIISVKDGIITALKIGETKVFITATCNDEEGTTKNFTLTVKVIEPQSVSYTISYRSNVKGFEKNSDTVEEGEDFTLGEAPEIEGYDFLGWSLSLDFEAITELENINEDKVVYAIYAAKEYEITYNLDGGEYQGVDKAKHGETIQLGTPEKEGFDFLGWSLQQGGTQYVTEVLVEGPVTLYANWEEQVVEPTEYTITYDLDGGEYQGVAKAKHGETIQLGTPEKEGFDFLGWVLEGTTEYITEIEVLEDVTLVAEWAEQVVEPTEYTITYDLDGGKWNAQYGTPAEIGAEFIAEFNAFNGMSISMSELDTDYMGSNKFGNFFKDENNFAKWHWLLVAVWEVNESPEDFDPDNKDFSDLIGFYMANFNGYFTSTLHSDTWLGNTSVDFSNPAISKAVTEKSEPVSSDVIPEEYTKGVGLEVLPTPLKDEFIFDGWMMPNGEVITSIPATMKGALQLKAVWKPLDTEYTITYELDGGSYEGAQSAVHGSTLTLGIPEKEGFDFLGWSLQAGSTEYITEIVVKEDLVIYANWEEIIVIPEGTYQITYDLDGGHWVYTYYTPAEIGAQFIAEFNKFNGMNITPSELDTNNMSSTKFGNFFKNADNLNKWMWLLDAVWEVAKGNDSNKASTADFGKGAVIGFYMANLNGYFTSKQHKDTWLEKLSADYADPDNSLVVTLKSNPKSEEAGPATYEAGVGIEEFPTPLKDEHIFMGWVDEQNNPVTSISTTQIGAITLKAVWEHETIAEGIQFTNLPEDGVKLYTELQLEWVVTPEDAVNKNVLFYSLDSNIISVTENGIIKGVSEGTGRIRVRLESNPEFEMILSVKVWNGDYFDVYYVTESYMRVGETIQLFAEYVDKAQERHEVTWSSLTDSIATVNAVGEVTGVAEGLATIRATYNDDKYFDFYVTVLSSELSDEMMFVLGNHISNAKTTYDLGIGDGNPEYYYDVVSGVNNLIFDELKIDRRYYDQLPEGTKNYGVMSSVEFITVHYTGNMAYSADADNNCDYFNDLDYRASIHFVTGRTNLSDLTGLNAGYSADAYYAFAGLNEKYAGWHATNGDPCVWDDTGLLVQDTDPLTPVISISENNKYTINGRETNITIPEVPEGYTVNGAVLTVDGKQYSVFNQYGLRAKVEDGKYYLARTHWGTQRSPRAICTCGGNRNSIGIESCVDKGSDLEHTWHVTAQLVAKLLLDNNLGFDRVVGHHFFSGKDCPQPFLERDMKLWYEFMDMVKAEYERITSFKDAVITAKAINGEGVLRDNGLLIQDSDAHCVTYEVSINVNGQIQKVTLATCVESCLKFDGTRQYASLQIQGYPVI